MIRYCKNCGKPYETCHTNKPKTDLFRWQDVACSPECGAAYFAAVLRARGEVPPVAEDKKQAKKTQSKKAVSRHKPDENVSEVL